MQSLQSPPRDVRPRSDRWPRLDAVFADRAEMRTAALNQLVLAGVVLLLTFLMFHHGFTGNVPLFFAGVAIVFVLTALAIAAPWGRIPFAWSAAVPLGDIIAISLMRFADPAAGIGVLFAFPVLWLSASFALAGFVGGVSLAVIGFASSVAAEPRQFSNFGVFLLPVMLVVIGATAYSSARRAAAQRRLLRRQAEILAQALERSRHQEQLLSEVLDTADLGVLHIEYDGAISVMNDGEGHLQHLMADADGGAPSGYDRDGRTLIPTDRLPLARALRGEEFDDERVWIEPVAGERRALSVTVHRLASTDAEPHAGAVLVCRDVTAEMSALQARDLLVSSVSHELRTPLTSIIGHIELALDAPGLPASAASSLAIADRNADRLLALVGDVLAASSHAATLPMTPEDVDVLEIVKASAQSVVTGQSSRNVTIDLSRAMPARGYVDPLRLRQVVDNLLSNAIKYNREGGRVSLMTATRGRKTLILVEDTGVGLDEEDLVNVFQRYYRGAAVRRAGVEGSGLGLSISRDIVRRLGGDIYVNSTLGVGSTFTVSIPAVRPGVATQPAVGSAGASGGR